MDQEKTPERSDYAHLWNELSIYLGFEAEHARALRDMKDRVTPFLPRIVGAFYLAVERNPEARATFRGGDQQIERQKGFLEQWLNELFCGVYDRDFVLRHARIGRTHVRIGLRQSYMFGAMGLLRRELHAALRESAAEAPDREVDHTAVDLICDLELAIMLETYSENYVRQMRDRERLATLGQIAGFVGHELRNPLAVMVTSLHLLERRIPQQEERARKHLGRLSEQVRLSNEIIGGLTELTRDRKLKCETVDLLVTIQKTVKEFCGTREGVQVEVDVPLEARSARVDPTHFRQLLMNLLENAAYALQLAGRHQVWVSARREQDFLVLVVEDEGGGLDPEVGSEAFEALRTTRSKGLGLGLALCRKIAEKHGGGIQAESGDKGGARFVVRFADSLEDEGGG